jgi:hypothetical protein
MDRKGLRSILMVLLGTEKTGDLIAQRMKGLKVDRYRIILTPSRQTQSARGVAMLRDLRPMPRIEKGTRAASALLYRVKPV